MKIKNTLYLLGSSLFTLMGCNIDCNNPREDVCLGQSGWQLWLDKEAQWQDDRLYLPPVDVDTIVAETPTGGWSSLYAQACKAENVKDALDKNLPIKVNVPGTVEEYCWDALSARNGIGLSGNYIGVSWWTTSFKVPKSFYGKKLKLYFSGGVRQRAEIFVNEKLVGYELAHQLPFVVDITDKVKFDAENKLAVKITDPNGNFSWGDYEGAKWGKYYFPLSHGFGGILDDVHLLSMENVHVSDVFVKNKPSLRDIDVEIELSNEDNLPREFNVNVSIEEAWKNGVEVKKPVTIYQKDLGEMRVDARNVRSIMHHANVPNARLWEIKNSNLYNWVTTITDSEGNILDVHRQRFGFRYLDVVDYCGDNPRLYLNGKRTTLISAISWGFWPVNGIYPTKELARKHLKSASDLGMNMVNFHRCRGNERVISAADEMGMLIYQEPGGFSSYRTNPGTDLSGITNLELSRDLCQQRFLRMVKNDRNHPSVIYYNMVNEPGWAPDSITKETMKLAHKIDPTRFKSYGSGFMAAGAKQANKIHMLPNDSVLHTYGYCDIHNAGESQGVYIDENYTSPEKMQRDIKGIHEIFVWGEEGAVASPPHLELINKHKKSTHEKNGWDGADYAQWYDNYEKYLEAKNLKKYYPSVTNLIRSMADVMFYEHGRFLENARIVDDADIYVYNGFEDMKQDNFSGCVDVYRNIKGTSTLMSQYAKPLYVAVKLRDKIAHVGDTAKFDLYVINEHILESGSYKMNLRVQTPSSEVLHLEDKKVNITGGDKFSDFVCASVPFNINNGSGYYKIQAELVDKSGNKVADGHDELFAVDWKNECIKGNGAVLSYNSSDLVQFINSIGGNVAEYQQDAVPLDYICLGKMINGFANIPANNFIATDKKNKGLNVSYFRGSNFETKVNSRIVALPIDFNLRDKLIPGYDMLGKTDFSIRCEGYIKSDITGLAKFKLTHNGGVRVWIDDKLVLDRWYGGDNSEFKMSMDKDKMYKLKIEICQRTGDWKIQLAWNPPINVQNIDIDKILSRVKNEGTTLFILDGFDDWFYQLGERGVIPEHKVFYPAKSWVGSTFIVRKHPFFDGLPVNGAMNWEYQDLVRYDATRHFGLYDMNGEEPVVSVVGSPFQKISTSVGILPYGKGNIVFSSFDLISSLSKDTGASNVSKKVFTNYLKWAINKK